MAEFPQWVSQAGFASGGAVIAIYLAFMLIRFQRDFTNRYANELDKVRRDRDAAVDRANRYATILARHGIDPDVGKSDMPGHAG